MAVPLSSLRGCLEGAVPAAIATCAADGTPNVALLSHVHYVDELHVALSFQFFSKTRENVLANPRARVQVIDPDTGIHWRLDLHYLPTETEGPLFELMRARLAGIASQTDMSKVFRLQGADVYRVLAVESAHGGVSVCPPPRPDRLPALRRLCEQVAAQTDLASVLDATLRGLGEHLTIEHAMILMLDDAGGRLYTVASRGYPHSGVGSEIPLGQGVIGVAAREGTAIRIGHMALAYAYSRAVRQSLAAEGGAGDLQTEIPLPGPADSRSQLAVPLRHGGRVTGVLYVESPEERRFQFDDEDALAVLATQLAGAIAAMDEAEESAPIPAMPATQVPSGLVVTVRRYRATDSIFLGEDDLNKGVAGAIFWRLTSEYLRTGRTEFTNRELRLDPAIRLPPTSENLEARLILLQRRLAERCAFAGIEKTGRGRFRPCVSGPLHLEEMPA